MTTAKGMARFFTNDKARAAEPAERETVRECGECSNIATVRGLCDECHDGWRKLARDQ